MDLLMIKIILAAALSPLFCGVMVLLLRRAQNKPAQLLLFHHLTEQPLPRSLSEMPVRKFRDICSVISESNRNITTLMERKDEKDLTITFDDGFQSNLLAAEILREHNLTATFFICTAHLSNEPVTDVYGHQERLTEEEIRKLHREGFEIGSHTVHHLDMTLLDDETLLWELTESKEKLETVIDEQVVSLSLPYGLWNEKVIETAKEVGYRHFSVYNYPTESERLNSIYPATGVYPFDSVKDIIAKICGTPGNSEARAAIVPHFAKGSPLAAFSPLYRKIPVPWFPNRKENNQSDKKEN